MPLSLIATILMIQRNCSEVRRKFYRKCYEREVIAKISKRTKDLNESTITDSESFANDVRELNKKIQEESDRIERNIMQQTIKFGHDTDDLANDVEWKLHALADGIYALLPESVKL